MGYVKQWAASRPRLEGGAMLNEASPNVTATAVLGKRWCGADGCLKLGLLPADRFPKPGASSHVRASALVGRAERPNRNHRLRLDRYDEQDFEVLEAAMRREGLWMLP